MKKLENFLINPEKVIKNEELVILKGGSYYGGKIMTCTDDQTSPFVSHQPCAWYPDAQALVRDAIRKCANGNATLQVANTTLNFQKKRIRLTNFLSTCSLVYLM